jgi:hypothetical protein
VIAGDNTSSGTLMPWLGDDFRALRAATTSSDVKMVLPFDSRCSGMILGSGGIGMVFESEEGARRLFTLSASKTSGVRRTLRSPCKCILLGTLYSNSAYYGAVVDRQHLATEIKRFIWIRMFRVFIFTVILATKRTYISM